MPPKPDSQTEAKPVKNTTNVTCNIRSPGPKYQLKTLVGYRDHCLSRYKNPAYTFGGRYPGLQPCLGPGPKYVLKPPKQEGFTFGLRTSGIDSTCGPGPKYILPVPRGPAFSIKFRTKPRGGCISPGPYYLKPPRDGPAFTIGKRIPGLKCDPVPGPRLYSIRPVKPREPAFSIAHLIDERIICRSPGPKYELKPPKPLPMYSFGVRHSECAPPYIVECDEQC